MLNTLAVIEFISCYLILLAACIISLVRKNTELRPVQFFLFSNLIFDAVLFISPFLTDQRAIWNGIFNLTFFSDVVILYYYFNTLIKVHSLRVQLLIYGCLFFGLVFSLWFGPMHTLGKFWVTLFGLENLFIIIPCFLYFYQIFRSDEIIDLRREPHFFVICGLVFFYGTTFPFYIGYNTLYTVTPQLVTVFTVFDGILTFILYATFIKAYLCPQAVEK